MLTLDNCPVTIAELKTAQRFPPDIMDSELEGCLLAAAEYCSEWMGRGSDFNVSEGVCWTQYNCPQPVKRAIIMMAGFLFKNPNDSLYTKQSVVTTFLRGYRKMHE